MMSATPDSRILECFKSVKMLELHDSQLFPVDTSEIEIDDMNYISKEAANQTYNILQQMADIIFTSGNSRINESVSSKQQQKIFTFHTLDHKKTVTTSTQDGLQFTMLLRKVC